MQRQGRFYALQTRQDQKSTPDMVTGMSQVFHLDIYVLLDLGANLSFVIPYVAMRFGVVSTLVAESTLAKCSSYRNCPISVFQKIISGDLVQLDMLDFNIILGMDWLCSCYDLVDC